MTILGTTRSMVSQINLDTLRVTHSRTTEIPEETPKGIGIRGVAIRINSQIRGRRMRNNRDKEGWNTKKRISIKGKIITNINLKTHSNRMTIKLKSLIRHLLSSKQKTIPRLKRVGLRHRQLRLKRQSQPTMKTMKWIVKLVPRAKPSSRRSIT